MPVIKFKLVGQQWRSPDKHKDSKPQTRPISRRKAKRLSAKVVAKAAKKRAWDKSMLVPVNSTHLHRKKNEKFLHRLARQRAAWGAKGNPIKF